MFETGQSWCSNAVCFILPNAQWREQPAKNAFGQFKCSALQLQFMSA